MKFLKYGMVACCHGGVTCVHMYIYVSEDYAVEYRDVSVRDGPGLGGTFCDISF